MSSPSHTTGSSVVYTVFDTVGEIPAVFSIKWGIFLCF